MEWEDVIDHWLEQGDAPASADTEPSDDAVEL
jgi:hypothetical protein